MFISSSFLEINYGIDPRIAQFFVDREPPVDNLYWKDKLLYLRPAPGYLFIPLIVDLLYRLKIDRHQLLSEPFVGIMEQILHFSALEEAGTITENEAIKRSGELIKGSCGNNEWYNTLLDYFANNQEYPFYGLSTPFKALRRADLFLFSVSALSFPTSLTEQIAESWFALISILLLLDDSEDIETDKKTGDKNAFIESGLNTMGIQKIEELVAQSLKKIGLLNRAMSLQLKSQYQEQIKKKAFYFSDGSSD